MKLILLLLVTAVYSTEEECPNKCICKKSAQKDGSTFMKLRCGETSKITTVEELDLLNFASDIVQLNLSYNVLKSFSPKVELIALQKLDLSFNQLAELQSNQFSQVTSLRRLDLSGNNIKQIDILAFVGLKHLERLKLNQNQITTIAFGTFDPIVNLKQLDISSNPLVCDCGLLWLLKCCNNKVLKLISNPQCASPPSFKDRHLRKLKVGEDIHCKSPAGNSLPIIELKPSNNQIVFEGDSLNLYCKVPSISDDSHLSSQIEWTWAEPNPLNPKTVFPDITIEEQFLPSTGYVASTLRLGKLKQNHTGTWNCLYVSLQGNHSKGLSLIVISNKTNYCSMTTTVNNKGSYSWPRTVVNHTVSMPCESQNLNYDTNEQQAEYTCSSSGDWENLNTSKCIYISDTTRILQQFYIVNSSALESVRYFKNFTSNLSIFKDPMDFVFAIKTIQNYIMQASLHLETILIDIIDNLIDLPKGYLRKAEDEDKSCSKLLKAIEDLANATKSSMLRKSNIAIEVFKIKPEGFSGLRCVWLVNPDDRKDTVFSCTTNNPGGDVEVQGKVLEASVSIPASLFEELDETEPEYGLMVAMLRDSKLFNHPEEKEDLTSAIVGVKLVGLSVGNLTQPIYVKLRTPLNLAYEVTPFMPVWWDQSVDSNGKWSRSGCRFHQSYEDHTVFTCSSLGYFGLLQDITHLQIPQVQPKFKLSHPAIYVGNLIMIFSLLTAILTYLLGYNNIQMPKKSKHSLVNLWISIIVLGFFYTVGIYQTEDVKICQAVGMILHYLTLCSLLWMCVGVNCMYKRLIKNDVIGLQDDDLPSEQPVQKPILGLYLVGWGVALIICGLSAAINIKEYSSQTHCFLRTGPALSALYIPAAILCVFLGVIFLLIRCAIYNLDANGHLSEGTQATEHVDLDLLEPNFPNIETGSIRSVSSKTASSEVEDPEHGPAAQLKAYIIFLVIYVMTWLSCAFATVPPFKLVTFEEDLFSVAFAILATTLSAFTLFFYCVARNDVRTQWVICSRWWKKKQIFRSRNVSDASPNVPQIQIQPLPLPPATELQVVSRASSRSSHTKSNSTSNVLKGVDLNGSFSDGQGAKINNVNLVVLHRAQYRSNVIPNIIENPTNAEVFYNPHQSTVARKFFKRQKRHMMKKNNLRPREISDSASVFSDRSNKNNAAQCMFGTNSKVNNTNIHVEQVKRIQKQNPNLFSDSAEDYDSVAEKILSSDALKKRNRSRKKHNVKEDTNMRSVSQQCTLEYSSENVSDSILDKPSPEKSLLPNQESFLTEVSEAMVSVRRENSPMASMVEVDEAAVTSREDRFKSRSRGSSVSVSDLDELYQQIRRGPKKHIYVNSLTRSSPYLSDSEVTSYVSEIRGRRRDFDNLSDSVETTV